MAEETINGVRVVLRDKFPASYGWELLETVRRIDKVRRERISQELGRELTTEELVADPQADDVAQAIARVPWLALIQERLPYTDAVKFVRGAVAEWGFPGDLRRADCCDDLNTLHEFLPIVNAGVLLYYHNQDAEKLSGEAVSGSTSASEG